MVLEIICSNASPLRHLGVLKQCRPQLKAIDLLREMYYQVFVAYKVYEELTTQARVPQETLDFLNDRNIVEISNTQNQIYLNMLAQKYGVGLGERETLVLTKELQLPRALIANKGASHMFTLENVPYVELLDLFESCKQNGAISECEYRESISTLYQRGYRPKSHAHIFKQLGLSQ